MDLGELIFKLFVEPSNYVVTTTLCIDMRPVHATQQRMLRDVHGRPRSFLITGCIA